MKQIVKDILSDAHDLIEDEESWCAIHICCDADHQWCMSFVPEAERFSALGAISFAGDKRGADNQIKVEAIRAFEEVSRERIVIYNATHSHEQVLNCFKEAMQ